MVLDFGHRFFYLDPELDRRCLQGSGHDRFHGLGDRGKLGDEKIFKPKKMRKPGPQARLALWHLLAYLLFIAVYYIFF